MIFSDMFIVLSCIYYVLIIYIPFQRTIVPVTNISESLLTFQSSTYLKVQFRRKILAQMKSFVL